MTPADFFTPESITSIRAKFVAFAQSVNLFLTNWLPGATGQQTIEATNQSEAASAVQVSALVRGYASLDSSTDPGDPDPYNPGNASLAPAAGMLSAKGAGDYGTPRDPGGFAGGSVTLYNNYIASVTFVPSAVTFGRSTPFSGLSYAPTYRGTSATPVTVPAGSFLAFGIAAEAPGTTSNVPASGTAPVSGNVPTASTVLAPTVTLAPTGISIVNGPITGTDREAADAYRARCRESTGPISPNGPASTYQYLVTSANTDGTYGVFSSTVGVSTGNATATSLPIGATGVYVSQASATGTVQIFARYPSGPLSMSDVTTLKGLLLTSPGTICAPQGMTILVGVQSGPSAGLGGITTTVNVTWTATMYASAVPGGAAPGVYTNPGSPPATVQAIFDLIHTPYNDPKPPGVLAVALANTPIGGKNQTAGSGWVYGPDLGVAIANTAAPIPGSTATTGLGIFDVIVTVPGAQQSVPLGGVTVLGAVSGTLTLI